MAEYWKTWKLWHPRLLPNILFVHWTIERKSINNHQKQAWKKHFLGKSWEINFSRTKLGNTKIIIIFTTYYLPNIEITFFHHTSHDNDDDPWKCRQRSRIAIIHTLTQKREITESVIWIMNFFTLILALLSLWCALDFAISRWWPNLFVSLIHYSLLAFTFSFHSQYIFEYFFLLCVNNNNFALNRTEDNDLIPWK
jgi:hypothetical protein